MCIKDFNSISAIGTNKYPTQSIHNKHQRIAGTAKIELRIICGKYLLSEVCRVGPHMPSIQQITSGTKTGRYPTISFEIITKFIISRIQRKI